LEVEVVQVVEEALMVEELPQFLLLQNIFGSSSLYQLKQKMSFVLKHL
jgi:hypothetical protein